MVTVKYLSRNFGDIPIATISKLSNNEAIGDIVFIHMSWGGSWAFKFYMNFFVQNGYNTHALDLRGHGKSGGTVEGTTMQNYVDDVRTVVDNLGLQDPIIIGHSMGGLLGLMYSAQFGSRATVSLDGSPSLEVQKTSEEKTYSLSYTPKDSGMPNPMKTMMVLSDIYPWRLMGLKKNLGVESGIARSERKLGISIPKESLVQPLLFIGAEHGTSLPFGIGIEKVRQQADYYGGSIVEIKGATHPGLLIGKHWKQTASEILKWLKSLNSV